MNQAEKWRKERDYVANYYGKHAIFWQERVAGMSREQITAIYLRFQAEDPPKQKPLPMKVEDPQQKLF